MKLSAHLADRAGLLYEGPISNVVKYWDSVKGGFGELKQLTPTQVAQDFRDLSKYSRKLQNISRAREASLDLVRTHAAGAKENIARAAAKDWMVGAGKKKLSGAARKSFLRKATAPLRQAAISRRALGRQHADISQKFGTLKSKYIKVGAAAASVPLIAYAGLKTYGKLRKASKERARRRPYDVYRYGPGQYGVQGATQYQQPHYTPDEIGDQPSMYYEHFELDEGLVSAFRGWREKRKLKKQAKLAMQRRQAITAKRAETIRKKKAAIRRGERQQIFQSKESYLRSHPHGHKEYKKAKREYVRQQKQKEISKVPGGDWKSAGSTAISGASKHAMRRRAHGSLYGGTPSKVSAAVDFAPSLLSVGKAAYQEVARKGKIKEIQDRKSSHYDTKAAHNYAVKQAHKKLSRKQAVGFDK